MKAGADDRDRTGDLVLTKDVLCQLSYIGPSVPARRVVQGITEPPRAWTRVIANSASAARGRLERETGIEPATNSLEGCDSTTELLPPTCGRPPDSARTPRRCEAPLTRDTVTTPDHAHGRDGRLQILPANRNSLEEVFRSAKVGGEGRVRTSVATRTADLQSAAIDRSATSPNSFLEGTRLATAAANAHLSDRASRPVAKIPMLPSICGYYVSGRVPEPPTAVGGAGGGI
jgi:hypothetical protein